MKTVLILGCNADIGKNVSQFFLTKNYNVIGTYRSKKPLFLEKNKVDLIRCDLNNTKDINKLYNYIKKKKIRWDVFFSSVGNSEPIDKFFNIKFSKWKESIYTNFLSQIQTLHRVYNLRNKKKISNVIFLAGGGTNGPFSNYSAYCVSKIALIKMCELIDDENKDLNIFIVGPGFTKTKTHLETIKAGKKAGKNLSRVKSFLKNENGTSFKDIFNCIMWGIKSGKKIASGRNISVVHDNWHKDSLKVQLSNNKDMYKLRRFKN